MLETLFAFLQSGFDDGVDLKIKAIDRNQFLIQADDEAILISLTPTQGKADLAMNHGYDKYNIKVETIGG